MEFSWMKKKSIATPSPNEVKLRLTTCPIQVPPPVGALPQYHLLHSGWIVAWLADQGRQHRCLTHQRFQAETLSQNNSLSNLPLQQIPCSNTCPRSITASGFSTPRPRRSRSVKAEPATAATSCAKTRKDDKPCLQCHHSQGHVSGTSLSPSTNEQPQAMSQQITGNNQPLTTNT